MSRRGSHAAGSTLGCVPTVSVMRTRVLTGTHATRAVVAYAPRVPRGGDPWLIEVDPASGEATAYLPAAEGGALHTRRDQAPMRRYASLGEACVVSGLDPLRDLELRWWDGVELALVTALELRRLGRTDLSVRSGDEVIVSRGEQRYAVRGPFELRRLVHVLERRAGA